MGNKIWQLGSSEQHIHCAVCSLPVSEGLWEKGQVETDYE